MVGVDVDYGEISRGSNLLQRLPWDCWPACHPSLKTNQEIFFIIHQIRGKKVSLKALNETVPSVGGCPEELLLFQKAAILPFPIISRIAAEIMVGWPVTYVEYVWSYHRKMRTFTVADGLKLKRPLNSGQKPNIHCFVVNLIFFFWGGGGLCVSL